MKKKLIYLLCAILFCPVCFAYEYSQAEKEKMYDDFLDGYFKGLDMQLNMLPIPENKKQEIRTFMKQGANKEALINETWGCVQYKDPFDMVGLQDCFTPWAQRKGQELASYIQNNMQQY